MSPVVPIAVHGASGRMGRAILRLGFEEMPDAIVAAIVRPGSGSAEKSLRAEFGPAADRLCYSVMLDASVAPAVLIDFSSAQAFDDALAIAVARGIGFVSGTTGLASAQHDALRKASATIPVLWSANFSIGVALLTRLARDAARFVPDWDCAIAETHHRDKKDAPSGTALALGRAIADARGVGFEGAVESGAKSPRDAAAIGFAVTRAGDVVGEHSVTFAGKGERIELVHRATDRDVFARGALEAAVRIASRPAGLYALADLLDHRDR